MTLSWALLFKLMPARAARRHLRHRDDDEGLGADRGPLLAGLLIDVLEPHLEATQGYQILWPFCAFLVLASIPIVGRVWRMEAETSR